MKKNVLALLFAVVCYYYSIIDEFTTNLFKKDTILDIVEKNDNR